MLVSLSVDFKGDTPGLNSLKDELEDGGEKLPVDFVGVRVTVSPIFFFPDIFIQELL